MAGEEGAAAAAAEVEVTVEAVEEDVEGGVGAGAECKGGGDVTLCVEGGAGTECKTGSGARRGWKRGEEWGRECTKLASVRYGAQKF